MATRRVSVDVEFDTHEVSELARDLQAAPGRIQRRVPGVLRKGAVKIKAGMRRDFINSQFSGGHRGTYHPHIHRAINFDRIPDGYEIGVDKDGPQGGLGNILAFGTSVNAPIVDHTTALHREVPHILRELGEAGEESVLGDRSQ